MGHGRRRREHHRSVLAGARRLDRVQAAPGPARARVATLRLLETVQRSFGKRLARILPARASRAFVVELSTRDPQTTIGAVARFVKSPATDLDHMPLDLPTSSAPGFEHLAGLFASPTLDEGIISMNIRQTAYLFGLVRAMAPSRVVEIGRYKGGSTLVIAAAMVQAVGIPRGGAAGDFKLVKQVCRLAHLERVR